MVNINIRDNLFDAVDDFNRTMTDPRRQYENSKYSYEERRGIFYNCLRRQFSTNSPFASRFDVENLVCVFDEKNRIVRYHFLRVPPLHSSYLHTDYLRLNELGQLNELADELARIYPTRELNEMSCIVNSIK